MKMIAASLKMIPLSHDRLKRYRQFAIETFRQTFDRHNSTENMEAYVEKAFSLQLMEKELDPLMSAVFLAEIEGQTVGYIRLNFPPAFTHPVDPDSIELERIYVHANHQGKRIGEALLQKAMDTGRARGARFLWLGVWEQNTDARAFYVKKGFVIFGSHPFSLGEDLQTDLLMRIQL